MRAVSILTALSDEYVNSPVEIEAFTTTPDPHALRGVRVRQISAPEVENVRGLIVRMIGEIWVGIRGAREMLKDCGPSDLVIISSPGYLTALVIAAMARRKGVPYVLDLRDVYPQVYTEAGLLRRHSKLYRFFAYQSRVMYQNARLVIAVTRGLEQTVRNDAPGSSVVTVFNGFPSKLLRRDAKKHERYTVCFHGIMGFFQDIEVLLEVASLLLPHNIDMVVIGYGRKEKLVAESQLSNLRFMGRLSFDDTISEIEKCHLGLCLRKDDHISRDAFPVKVWEYLGLGIPCVVTPICEAGEFLEARGIGIQLPSGNIYEIVSTILDFRDKKMTSKTLDNDFIQEAKNFTRENMGGIAASHIKEIFDYNP